MLSSVGFSIYIKEYTKIDDELLNKIYHESYDYIFDSKSALELGIVDEII